MRTVGHKPGGLHDRPQCRSLAANVRGHSELAHVGEYASHIGTGHQLLDAWKAPAGGQVRVLMQEVLPVVNLVLVDLRTEFDIPLRLVHPLG